MPIYRITCSNRESIETPNRATAIDKYCSRVKLACAMNSQLSGESIALYRDGVRVLEHIGRKYLAEQVEARLIALDSAPANDNPLDL